MANKPNVLGTAYDINEKTIALTGDSQKLIRYHSNVYAWMEATATAPGASINLDTCLIINQNNIRYGMSGTFNNVESGRFVFSAEDSLGNHVNSVFEIPVVPYIKLTCNIGNTRPDAAGDMVLTCSGTHYNGSFGKSNNYLSLACRYKPHDGSYSNWINMTISTHDGSSYSAYAALSGLDYQKTYTFEVVAGDALEQVTASSAGVKSVPVFHWGENDFQFEVPVKFMKGTTGVTAPSETDGDFTVNGNLRVSGINSLYFGDEYGSAIRSGVSNGLYIQASKGLYLNGYSVEYGLWNPTLMDGAVYSYPSLYGWYSKLGNVVTVGFYIKANCNSGYQSHPVNIYNLPFTPACPAAGGGMCSGAYVSGGFTFQCFVAEPDGIITTRVQACNNTAAQNLSTSASGCFYPYGQYGGGELTLSGTITYYSAI